MKLGPVTKLDKRNKTTSKKLTLTSCRKIVTSLSFFRFLANLEQSVGLILGNFTPLPPPPTPSTPASKRTPKKPTQIRVKCIYIYIKLIKSLILN